MPAHSEMEREMLDRQGHRDNCCMRLPIPNAICTCHIADKQRAETFSRASHEHSKLVEALDIALQELRETSAETGFCMCGDKVESHNIGSGHSPVDEGSYRRCHIIEVLEKTRAARAGSEG